MGLRSTTTTLTAAALATTAALAVAAALLPAAAQSRGNLPKLLALPASTRAMALGGAYQPAARHSDGIFYNPALVNGATGMGVEIQQWGRRSSAAAASAAMAWFGGGVAVGLQTLQYGVPGASIPRHEDHLFAAGATPVSERVATAGYARKLFGFEWGVAGKLAEERFGASRSSVAMVDIGAARAVGPVVLGASVLDLGRRPYERDGASASPRVLLGAGTYGRPLGILDWGFSAAFVRSEGSTSAGGGLELGYWPITGRTFIVRVGAQSVPGGSDASPLTFGAAFWGDDLRLEWAYRAFGGGAPGTHRIVVAWH